MLMLMPMQMLLLMLMQMLMPMRHQLCSQAGAQMPKYQDFFRARGQKSSTLASGMLACGPKNSPQSMILAPEYQNVTI